MKKIKSVVLFLLFATFIFSIQSCESENEKETQEPINSLDTVKSGGPAPINFGTVFSCESDVISMVKGCYTFQIRFYLTTEDGKILLHSAIMKTGDCDQKLPTNPCEGNYQGDFIHTDYRLNGCIRDFLTNQNGAGDAYTRMRSQIISR